jgi:hypothetical protein
MLVTHHWSLGSTIPSASPGKSMPVGRPKPKRPRYRARRSRPSRSATLIMPTLLDSSMMSPIVIV